MAKKKVLLITAQVINERNYKRFSLNLFKEKYDFTILDVSYIFNKDSYLQNFKNRVDISNYHFVKSFKELNDQSDLLEINDLLIGLIGQENEITSKIYSFIKPYEEKLCVVLISAFPLYPLKMKFFLLKRIITKFNREKSFLGIIKKLTYIIKRKLFTKRENLVPGYFLVCGNAVANQYGFDTSKAKIIKSCSYDYLLSKNNYDNLIKEKYIVFLDENIINHTDFSILNAKVEDEELYYVELRNFFKFIENNFKLSVVVAAHPRSDISYTKKMLPDYKVLINQTAGLVKFSEGCIAHASTSINFAVIFKKPILFLTSYRMARTRLENYQLASWFNKIPINMSKELKVNEIENALTFDDANYSSYFGKFISCEKNSKFGFSELLEEFESIRICE
tara:strand:+ start:881 stop:2059 length:1179 start_codon:yes stop_codon:yes gene_type:complete